MVFPIIPVVIVAAIIGGSAAVSKIICKVKRMKDNQPTEIGIVTLQNEEVHFYDRSL